MKGMKEMRDRIGKLPFVLIVLLLAGFPIGIKGQDASGTPSSDTRFQDQNSDGDSKTTKPEAGESTMASQVENSIVKIFATMRTPDFFRPWTKQPAREVTGSGFVIEGRRILTNAHVVLYANQVQVQGNRSSAKISADVEFVAPGIDLAVLKLDDESFFESHAPLPRTSDLPKVRDSVLVYGYPVGGDNLSITKGIVSRLDFASYNYEVSGLRVQIDAAINPGNSGGPAIVGNKVIGVAFSRLSNSQSIGYIIPSEEIDLFLSDIADGLYEGKPVILEELQTLENPALRDFLDLDNSTEGLVVNRPFSDDSSYPLRQWDVIAKIGDTPIDNQGNILLKENLKINFSYILQNIVKDGILDLTVVRSSSEISVELPMMSRRPRLIPHLPGEYPPYFIFGPVVFSIASEDLISALVNNRNSIAMSNALSITGSPMVTRRNDTPAFEGEELVIIPSPLFAHSLSKGYSHPTMRVVKKINGMEIKNLRHLVEVIRDSEDDFITIEFVGYATESLVFHRKEMINATEEVLNDSGIRNFASPDMLAIWELPTGTSDSNSE